MPAISGTSRVGRAPIYDTKGHLAYRVIPKLAKATPGFPYFSLDAIKAELEKHRGGVKPESLNHYMHELTSEGVVYDAGRRVVFYATRAAGVGSRTRARTGGDTAEAVSVP